MVTYLCFQQFALNFIGAVVIIGWTTLWGVAIFGILSKLNVLRVSAEMERIGEYSEQVLAYSIEEEVSIVSRCLLIA